ncbi:MAG: ATP-binding protein [Candidatus Omnitrophica bacterium]|nr:ATP-binding protein [Candidatus Omnitrophota bacterium]
MPTMFFNTFLVSFRTSRQRLVDLVAGLSAGGCMSRSVGAPTVADSRFAPGVNHKGLGCRGLVWRREGAEVLLAIGLLTGLAGFAGGVAAVESLPEDIPFRAGLSAGYLIDHWQTEDGLPQNTVTSILQTRDGYLWIGTMGGLARFDGLRFTVFGVRGSAGPSDNRILCLDEDTQGRLWIGTEGGGLCLYEHGTFTTFRTADGLSSDIVRTIAEDASGRIWIGTASGFNRWENGRFVAVLPSSSLALGEINGLAPSRGGGVFVSSGKGFWKIDKDRISPLDWANSRVEMLTRQGIFEDRAGWIWGYGDAFLWRWRQGRLEDLSGLGGTAPTAVSALLEGSQGGVWIGTVGRGLFRFEAGRFSNLTVRDGLSQDHIRCLYEDLEGNLWIGTETGGLNRLRRRRLTVYSNQQGLANEVITSLAEDDRGELWVGSNGAGLYHGKDGQFENSQGWNRYVNSAFIGSLCPGGKNCLWAGTWGRGLWQIKAGQTFHFVGGQQFFGDAVLAMCPDDGDGLWIGTARTGLYHYDGRQFQVYTAKDGIANQNLCAIVRARDGALWIASNGGGLNCRRRNRFTVYDTGDGLPSNLVRALFEDATGQLWIGTGGGGLSCWIGGRFRNLSSRDGLPDDFISQILEDNQGNLWFGSNHGIFRVSKQELADRLEGGRQALHCVSYGKEEGMPNLECTAGFHPACLETRDGKLWFSTVEGLVMVDPAGMKINRLAPPVMIERVLADGETCEDRPGRSKPVQAGLAFRQITLSGLRTNQLQALSHRLDGMARSETVVSVPPGTRSLEFDYTALCLTAPQKVRFKYQLVGFDKDWIEAGAERWARYTRLPPGNYRFRVTACNNDGVWNKAGSSLALFVVPFFWQTWWFKTAIGLVGIAGLTAMVRYLLLKRMQRQLALMEMRNALEKERTRIASDIHDSLGASLMQIALLGELVEADQTEPGKFVPHSRSISDIARSMGRTMDELVWAVRPENDHVESLVSYVSRFSRDYLQLANISFRLDCPVQFPHVVMATEMRHNLFLAVREAVHNAVKHSGASTVVLRFALDENLLTIQVADNGRGFTPNPMADSPSGDGLKNMKKRLADLGGQCVVESRPGAGTRIRFALAIKSS